MCKINYVLQTKDKTNNERVEGIKIINIESTKCQVFVTNIINKQTSSIIFAFDLPTLFDLPVHQFGDLIMLFTCSCMFKGMRVE